MLENLNPAILAGNCSVCCLVEIIVANRLTTQKTVRTFGALKG